MGQYYKSTFKYHGCRTWRSFSSYDFSNGAKLMEHSYIGNKYVNNIMAVLTNTPCRVIWAGDYADEEPNLGNTMFNLAIEMEKPNEKGISKEVNNKRAEGIYVPSYDKTNCFIVNHDKKLFVDLRKIEVDKYGYRINPLPILTAEGNGRGGGDYHGSQMELVGSWARNMISVEADDCGYKELEVKFEENDY